MLRFQPEQVLHRLRCDSEAATTSGIRQEEEGERRTIERKKPSNSAPFRAQNRAGECWDIRKVKNRVLTAYKEAVKLNPKLEKLRAEQEKAQTVLTQLQHQQQRLQNRISYIERGERQKRAHRLITKGAAIESLAPATKEMGEAEFFSMMEQILSLPSVLPLLPKGGGG